MARSIDEIAATDVPEADRILIRNAPKVTRQLYTYIGERYFPRSPVLARGVIEHIRQP